MTARAYVEPGRQDDRSPDWEDVMIPLVESTLDRLARELPQGRDWVRAGSGRYRGRWSAAGFDGWCFVATDGTRLARLVADEQADDWPAEVVEDTFRWLEQMLADEARPPCVVPDCGSKARMQFRAAEPGRLAGRDWKPGDPIDLCPPHGNDVYRAQGVYGLDQLAEWLRPDAKLDLMDQYDVGFGEPDSHLIRGSRARMLHVTRRGQ